MAAAIRSAAVATAADLSGDNVQVDNTNSNSGPYNAYPGPAHWLFFGGTGSGEALSSQRTGGTGQYGLDFYTGFIKRMHLANSGNLNIGDLSGTLEDTGLVNLRPPQSVQALNVHQSGSGTPSLGNFAFNDIQITSDNSHPSLATEGSFVTGLNIGYNFGGSGTYGQRAALQTRATLTAATSNTDANITYTGGVFQASATSGDGGTSGFERGSIFGSNPYVQSSSDASYLNQVVGEEIDVSNGSPTTRWKGGLIVALTGEDNYDGTAISNLVSLANNGRSSVRVGIEIGPIGSPIAQTGTIMKATGGATVATGIDFYDYNITGNLIQGKYSALTDYGGIFLGAGPSYGSTNVAAQGGAADIHIKIAPKGNGLIQVGNAGSFSGVPQNAAVVRKWLKVLDDTGAVYYMPLYQ